MPQQPAQLSEVNQVLNAKVQKRTMKLAQVNHALQAEIRVRQRAKAGSGNLGSATLVSRLSFFTGKTYAPGIRNPVFLRKNLVVIKNPVFLVSVRPGLTDRVISGEELLIDKLNLM